MRFFDKGTDTLCGFVDVEKPRKSVVRRIFRFWLSKNLDRRYSCDILDLGQNFSWEDLGVRRIEKCTIIILPFEAEHKIDILSF